MQALGLVLNLCSSSLFIPIVFNLMLVYPCSGTWFSTGLTCYTGVHMFLLLFVTVVLVVFLALLVTGARSPPTPPHPPHSLPRPVPACVGCSGPVLRGP